MIQLNHINKSFGSLQVLKDISLTINSGEILAIAGPSGAGKTTLLQIAGTLDVPDSGEVIYDGREVTGFSDRRLSRFRNGNIGFIFQQNQLLPEFTAVENVILPALIGGASRKVSKERAMQLLDMLGVGERATHKPAAMSGGERQRVAIARSLINSPGIVFADEPTGSLDSRNRDEIISLIGNLRERLGQTFVIVTHDPIVSAAADRTIEMLDGRISCITEKNPAPDRVEAEPE